MRKHSLFRMLLSQGVYNLTWLLAALFYLPVFMWRLVLSSGFRRVLPQRLGFVPETTSNRQVIWIHGVSVGEIKTAGNLVQRLGERYPDVELVISATTPTGYKLARELYPGQRVIFYPYDFAFCPRLALSRVRPACVLIMEREIWPNFLWGAFRRNIAMAIVNGRISEHSARGYKSVRGLLPHIDLIDMYCVQDEEYAQRLRELGVNPATIRVTGNMKYDNVKLKEPSRLSAHLRSWLSPDGRLVIVCGSTHAPEEIWLCQAVRRVEQRLGARVRVVLVPRHPERTSNVVDGLKGSGLCSALWSRQDAERLTELSNDAILVVDTIGHLENFYGACDVAFVGGSLIPHGGQNMLEPAALGKAVLFGPHVHNFRMDVHQLLRADAARQASGLEDLDQKLEELLVDRELRSGLGERAVALIRRNQGSTDRTLEELVGMLDRFVAAPAQATASDPSLG
ncbi:MAG: 3-deoxy-D-manno-octulosonic acid transferase [Planctomycetota bacterium]